MESNFSEVEIKIAGLAVDIDETLAWTIGYWVEEMQKKFGNPEELTVKEMVEKYRYTQNVPYWQHAEAMKWVDEKIHSNETQKELPLIEDADFYLKKINDIVPVAAYLTIRPENVLEGTKDWLDKHGFPAAPIICRPLGETNGSQWKARVLSSLYPKILGIIDDNAKLLEFLDKNYPGTVFLYDHKDNKGREDVIACPNWLAVYKEIKDRFRDKTI